MYLFAEADATTNDMFGETRNTEEESDSTNVTWLRKNGILCTGPAATINELLSVYNYIRDWNLIPGEELHASSVQHPDYENMRWLLHTRRVPKSDSVPDDAATPRVEDNTVEATNARENVNAPLPRCVGVGDKGSFVWACSECANALCRPNPVMPDLALMKLDVAWACPSEFQESFLGHAIVAWAGSTCNAPALPRARAPR